MGFASKAAGGVSTALYSVNFKCSIGICRSGAADWQFSMLIALPTLRFILIASCFSTVLVGCARWSSRATELEDTKPSLPKLKLAPDTLVVETALIRLPPQAFGELAEIWQQVDETILDIQQRTILEHNGLRAGVLIGHIPSKLQQHIDQMGQSEATDPLELAGLSSDAASQSRRLQCRAGRRKELVIRSEISDPIHLFTVLDSHMSGDTYYRATTLFDLRAIPNADGSAVMSLTPEVQHGELRQSYVSSEFGVRPELRREQVIWEELEIQTEMREGQILVVSSSLPPRSVGDAFFVTNNADRGHDHLVLLVRLAKTQLDDLFAPERVDQAALLSEQ